MPGVCRHGGDDAGVVSAAKPVTAEYEVGGLEHSGFVFRERMGIGGEARGGIGSAILLGRNPDLGD